jgi:hypothetical protein
MAALPEEPHCEASMRCGHVLAALLSERDTHKRELPIAPVEPPSITLSRVETGLGHISVAACPPFSSLSITMLHVRIFPGRSVTLVLASRAGSAGGAAADALAAVASTALVEATIEPAEPPRRSRVFALAERMRTWWSSQAPAPTVASVRLLPVTYEPSVTHGGVFVSISVPASAPEGSRVVISRVSVAGCDVTLGEAPLEVIVGFNHAPAPAHPVSSAATAGVAPALAHQLDGGALTEETDEVSCRRWRC